ncbi:unnamed protein product [Meganyctiphanes norvegica]|uniref:Uncharacterized protein n=1 Tax=Meganyctiphanes norvegica TaxID=48144 RepID=A0AAV2SGP1_MEGNR
MATKGLFALIFMVSCYGTSTAYETSPVFDAVVETGRTILFNNGTFELWTQALMILPFIVITSFLAALLSNKIVSGLLGDDNGGGNGYSTFTSEYGGGPNAGYYYDRDSKDSYGTYYNIARSISRAAQKYL